MAYRGDWGVILQCDGKMREVSVKTQSLQALKPDTRVQEVGYIREKRIAEFPQGYKAHG